MRTEEKDSKFELLKIFAMLLIVIHHFVSKNAYNIDAEVIGITPYKLFLQFIGNHAFIANNLFFMSSAWFLCYKEPSINWRKTLHRVWSLEKIMLFYSIGIALLFLICKLDENVCDIKYIMPLSTNLWWYPTSYALFLIFYPYFHKGLNSLTKLEVRHLLFCMFALWVIPTIIPYKNFHYGAHVTTNFFMLYVIIYYFLRFKPVWISEKKYCFSMILGGYTIAFISIIILDILGNKIQVVNNFACYYIRGNNRILPVIISIGLFLWMLNWKVKYNKLINWIGGGHLQYI